MVFGIRPAAGGEDGSTRESDSIGTAHARPVELALVVADDRAEGPVQPKGSPGLQDEGEEAVELGVAVEGELQRGRVVEPEHLEEEAALDLRDETPRAGDSQATAADRLGNDQVAVRVAPLARGAGLPHHVDADSDAGHVVVDHRRMAEVRA